MMLRMHSPPQRMLLAVLFALLCRVYGWNINLVVSLRLILQEMLKAGGILSTSLLLSISEAATSGTLHTRLNQDILKQPPVSAASELNAIDNIYFPDWLAGTPFGPY